jgi:hypothetical protein
MQEPPSSAPPGCPAPGEDIPASREEEPGDPGVNLTWADTTDRLDYDNYFITGDALGNAGQADTAQSTCRLP